MGKNFTCPCCGNEDLCFDGGVRTPGIFNIRCEKCGRSKMVFLGPIYNFDFFAAIEKAIELWNADEKETDGKGEIDG